MKNKDIVTAFYFEEAPTNEILSEIEFECDFADFLESRGINDFREGGNEYKLYYKLATLGVI